MGIVQGLMMSYGAKDESPDIVLKVVTSGASKKIGINKYFNVANYTIDWGDGTTTTATTTNASGGHSKTYASAGTYYITLVNPGSRWLFLSSANSLVPTAGFTGASVGVESMPSLKDWFGDSETSTGNQFFRGFNQSGALTSLPVGSFDTSNITSTGTGFFSSFNQSGALTSLPVGGFDTRNITSAGGGFFDGFNRSGALTSLPSGSFDTSNITNALTAFFRGFNYSGALTSLPAGSFDTSNITNALIEVFSAFNKSGALTSLPSGSFNTSNITSTGGSFLYEFNSSGAIPKVSAGTGVAIKNASGSSVYFLYPGGYNVIGSGGTFDGYAKS